MSPQLDHARWEGTCHPHTQLTSVIHVAKCMCSSAAGWELTESEPCNELCWMPLSR